MLGGPQRPKIHQCGISRKNLTLNSSQCTFLSAVVAADWLRLDGGMEASRLHAAVKLEPVCGDHSAQKGTQRAIQSQAFVRNPTLVDFGALWTL